MQYPTIFDGLKLACAQGKLPGIDLTDITYYIGRETIIPREDVPGMWVWRETGFGFLQRNAERAGAFFRVSPPQGGGVGTQIRDLLPVIPGWAEGRHTPHIHMHS